MPDRRWVPWPERWVPWPERRRPLPSTLRGRRRTECPAGRRRRRRPRPRALVRGGRGRPRGAGLPQPARPLPRHRHRRQPGRTRRRPDPGGLRAPARRPGQLRRRGQRGTAARGGLGVLLPAPRRRGAGSRRHPPAGGGDLPLERRHRRAEARRLGGARARRSRWATPPTSSGRPPRSSIRASSTRSSTTPCATCSSCPRRACSCAPTCSAPWAASTRASASRATTSTCAGAPTPPGRGCWSCRRRRARHRQALTERGTVIDRPRLAARNRLRSVLGNYSGGHLLRVVPQHALLTMGFALGGLVTGRGHAAAAELGAWPWNLARVGELRAKRRGIKATRLVPDREVRALQVRGSARLAAIFRGRAAAGSRFSAVGAARRNLVAGIHAPRSSIVAWVVFLALFLIGSRSLITDGVAAVGTLLPFPSQATDLFREYLSPWSFHGLGSAVSLPTGLPLLGAGRSGHLRPDGAAADPARARPAGARRAGGVAPRGAVREPAGQAHDPRAVRRRAPRLQRRGHRPLGGGAGLRRDAVGAALHRQALRPRAVRSPRGRRPTAVRGPRRRPRPPHRGGHRLRAAVPADRHAHRGWRCSSVRCPPGGSSPWPAPWPAA